MLLVVPGRSGEVNAMPLPVNAGALAYRVAHLALATAHLMEARRLLGCIGTPLEVAEQFQLHADELAQQAALLSRR